MTAAVQHWRSRISLLRFAFLALLLIASGGETRAEDRVLWLKTDWPPVFMQNRQGFGDAALAWLQERLPAGYVHDIRALPLARLLRTMEDREATVCTSNLLRTPAREAQFLISRDIMRMPAHSLIVRSADAAQFKPLQDARGMVEFRQLMQHAELDGAINEHRAYGAALDGLLRQAAPATQVTRLPKTSGMVSMLAAKRVDWVLLYPFEATWLARQEAVAPEVMTLPIAEIPAVNLGGITCNRTATAAKLITEIDALIVAHPDEPWLTPMYAWLDPETRQRLSAQR